MTNVIGPLLATAKDRAADWFTMRELREDIKFYKSVGDDKYSLALKKENETYHRFLSSYVSGKVA